MKVIKVLLTVILAMVIALTAVTTVRAAEDGGVSGTLTLTQSSTPSPEKYKVGDEIVIDISLSVVGMEGVVEFSAETLEYDTTLLKYKGIEPRTGWSINSESDPIYIVSKDVEADVSGVLGKLKFEVIKEFETTEVKVGDIDSSDHDGNNLHYAEENINDAVVTVKPGPKAEEPDPPTPENPDDPTPENPDDPTPENPDKPTPENPDKPTPDKPNNQEQNKGNKDDSAVPATKIPQTGQFGIAVFVIGLVLIAVIMRRKYTKMKDIK